MRGREDTQGGSEDPRWSRVLAREAAADGAFVFAVKSTGVFCRPSCASRHTRYENVEFFATGDEASQAGYRACKRCEPELPPLSERRAQMVVELCRFIETCEVTPTLTELAEKNGMSESHTRRLFKEVTGLSPKQYANSQLRRRMQHELSAGSTVTDAIFAAGFQSTSRFYEKSSELLGMSAGEYRSGAKDQEIRFAVGECSLGSILVAATAKGVCAVLFGDEPNALIGDLEKRFAKAELVGADAEFESTVAQVVAIVESPRLMTSLPLDLQGTAFQQRVWQALRAIEAGRTATYSEVANAIGSPKSVRAVAGACGANHLAVLVPCHRVVRKGGAISGYRWGVERKRELLEREKQTPDV
jgi:AraC family transcriptional regulator of adaptative response/methylated-DNA-[protein]-cysteine methyltransferase